MVIQGTAADIIKVAMVRCRDELRDGGLVDPARAPDPRRAAVRGARGEVDAASEIVRARDGRRVRDGSPARGRRGGGGQLARGEVVDTKGVAVLATVFAGGLIALQAPINSMLGKIGREPRGGSVSFVVGTSRRCLITLLVGGGFGDVGEARHAVLVLPDRRRARRRLRDHGARRGPHAGRGRRDGGHDRRASWRCRSSIDRLGVLGPGGARASRQVACSGSRCWPPGTFLVVRGGGFARQSRGSASS